MTIEFPFYQIEKLYWMTVMYGYALVIDKLSFRLLNFYKCYIKCSL